MLGKKPKKNMAIETLVGAQSRVEGDLEFSGATHVDGIINGGVRANGDSGSTLSVSDKGEIHGNVEVPYVVLNGLVKGDVTAYERVELGATARVIGNVYYKLIETAIGAEINGKLVHQSEPGNVETLKPVASATGSDD